MGEETIFVPWITASDWDASGQTFSLTANIGDVLEEHRREVSIPYWYGARLTVKMSSFPNNPFFWELPRRIPTRDTDESSASYRVGRLPVRSDQSNGMTTVSLSRILAALTRGYRPSKRGYFACQETIGTKMG